MVSISSLKEEGDLQSGYLVLDMAEIGTKLDSQSSPTAPPVNTKAMYPVWILIFAVLFRGLGQGPNKLLAGQRDRRFSCVYDSPPGFGAEPQQAVDPPFANRSLDHENLGFLRGIPVGLGVPQGFAAEIPLNNNSDPGLLTAAVVYRKRETHWVDS
ncbi:hypothetical protein C8J57DRAFT_1212804 [Mycena rebaudengoi]|nr:hypothetical protein C8J57DRAFT_1212804 [Mycena rebaudengoi]